MKKRIFAVVFSIFTAATFGYGQSNSWNNLTPLYTTRAEVEKLLGKPVDNVCAFNCRYEFAGDVVSVRYVQKTCDAGGWNVAPETVLNISIYPKKDIDKSFDELNLDRKKFSVSVDDILFGRWVNPDEGLLYGFDDTDRFLKVVSYLPKKSDNNLRCNGFPPFAPEGNQMSLDDISFFDPQVGEKESLDNVLVRADNFIAKLINNKDKCTGHVLIYFDKKLPLKKYENRLRKLKAHFQKRKVFLESVNVIEGGMREDSMVEFYILPKESMPPTPEPTLPSPQFMRK